MAKDEGQKKLKLPTLIFTGMAGAGKTTLIDSLTKKYKLKRIDIYDAVSEVIAKIGKSTLNEKELRMVYKNFFKELPRRDFDIIEIASEWPDEILPRLVEIIRGIGKERIILVFCQADKGVVLKRIKERGRPIPMFLIREHNRYTSRYFSNLCAKIGIEFLSINTNKGIKECGSKLIRKFEQFQNG